MLPSWFLKVYLFNFVFTIGDIHSALEILLNLQAIVLDDSTHPKNPLAVLTSEDRDSWSSTRQELENVSTNIESLKMIDSALYILCLDDNEPETPEELTKVFLHGNGSNR